MNNITIRQGETLQLPITIDDGAAETVLFQIIKNNKSVSETIAIFENKKANILIEQLMLPIGEYRYMLTITYTDGIIDKLPDVSDCNDDSCELPTINICEGIFESI